MTTPWRVPPRRFVESESGKVMVTMRSSTGEEKWRLDDEATCMDEAVTAWIVSNQPAGQSPDHDVEVRNSDVPMEPAQEHISLSRTAIGRNGTGDAPDARGHQARRTAGAAGDGVTK